jgi:hypothetical protein
MEKEKKKVQARPILTKSRASSYFHPLLHKVGTIIEADDPCFIPEYGANSPYAIVLANVSNGTISISSGGMDTVDCGFSLELQPGYRINVESLIEGVIVALNFRAAEKQRMHMVATNVRNEVVRIKHRQPFAKISLEPVHIFDWILNDTRSIDRGKTN